MTAQNGNKVKVHYTGTLSDGTQFDSSVGREPLEFTVGSGQVIVGFDAAVLDLEPGQSRTVNIPADQAYGQPRAELVMQVPRTKLPPDMKFEVGQELYLPQGASFVPVQVVAADAETVTLDANHRLAGKDLTFKIELVAIVSNHAPA